jgi:hypothetical protein
MYCVIYILSYYASNLLLVQHMSMRNTSLSTHKCLAKNVIFLISTLLEKYISILIFYYIFVFC